MNEKDYSGQSEDVKILIAFQRRKQKNNKLSESWRVAMNCLVVLASADLLFK